MAKELVIALIAVSFIVMVIGAVLWGLSKKGGILIAIIGLISLFSSLLLIPKGGYKNNSVDNAPVAADINFTECYYAYKENELRADDTYKGNRYRLTAQVRDIQSTAGSLLYWDDEVIVEFEIVVDNTIVVGEALFYKDQTDSLKDISVGDTITFIGECRSAGAWINCELDKNKDGKSRP